MFKLTQSDTFWWPVEVQLPIDGGRFEKATFDGQFKRKTVDELQALQARDGITDNDFIHEVLVGWNGVSDGGQDAPFSEAALGQMLQIAGVAAAVVGAYYGAVAGLKRKN